MCRNIPQPVEAGGFEVGVGVKATGDGAACSVLGAAGGLCSALLGGLLSMLLVYLITRSRGGFSTHQYARFRSRGSRRSGIGFFSQEKEGSQIVNHLRITP